MPDAAATDGPAQPSATTDGPVQPPAAASTGHQPAPVAAPAAASGPGTPAQQAFIDQVAPGAIAAQRTYGVPAAVTIAQAIEESGWGQSTLAVQDHNLFGIKGAGPAGSDSYPTQEFQNGQWVTTTAQFRAYHDIAQSIEDHGKLLATSGYYTAAMAVRQTPDSFAQALTGVYATDPELRHQPDQPDAALQPVPFRRQRSARGAREHGSGDRHGPGHGLRAALGDAIGAQATGCGPQGHDGRAGGQPEAGDPEHDGPSAGGGAQHGR